MRAIEDVMAGQAGLSPSVQRLLVERVTSQAPAPAVVDLPDGLTRREAEILALIAEGLSNPEISRALHISTATVKTHINNLFAKTGVRDRAQAMRYAYQQGLALPPGTSIT